MEVGELEIINNVNRTLKDDLALEIHRGSKVSIAAACFSIYAFEELKIFTPDNDTVRIVANVCENGSYMVNHTLKGQESYVLIVNAVCMELSLKLSSEMK